MKDVPVAQVLIVGAGASGLTLAIDLARRGVPFRLIEKMPKPFAGSRGKGIQPRSQEILEDLGVLDRLVALGGLYPVRRSYREDGSFSEAWIIEPADATPDEPYHIALMAPQFMTEQVLRDRLAELGGGVEFGCELVGFAQDEAGVTARLVSPAGEETVRAAFLVGADGGRSFVRQALGIDFPGETLGTRAVVADVRLDGLGRDAWHSWNESNRSRQLAICPLGGTDLFQIQAPVPLEGAVDTSLQGLADLVRSRSGRDDIILRELSWGSAYSMNARLADRYRQGRIFLVGDAAHTHPPTGGQGLNTSLQDAYNLGWKLGAVLLHGAPDALLDTYEAERRPVAASVLGLSKRLLDEARTGAMKRGREVHQLDLAYPASALSVGAEGRCGGIAPGSRAPDAPLVGAGGQPTRLFEQMRGPHWLAVGYEADRATAPSPRPGLAVRHIGQGGDLLDEGGHFASAYGLEAGTWMLIRPDGYVGAVVGPDGAAALAAYLPRVGL